MRTIRESIVIDGITWRVDLIADPGGGGAMEFRHGELVRRLESQNGDLPSVTEFTAMTAAELGELLARAEGW